MTQTYEVGAASDVPAEQRRRPGRLAFALVATLSLAVLTAVALRPSTPTTPAADSAVGAQGVERSVAALERRVRQHPDALEPVQQLGAAYVAEAARTGDPSFYGLAEQAFDRADELQPDDPLTVLGRGTLALARHEFDDALTLGQRAVEMLPASAEALAVVVDAEVELGAYEQAAAHTQQLLDLKPGLPALARASYLRELHGDLDGARTLMAQAEQAGGVASVERATAAALLGDLQLRSGDVDAAATSYQRARQTAPDLAIARLGEARVRAARGDHAGAVALLDRLVASAPVTDAAVLLGALHEQTGDAAAAGRAHELVDAFTALQQDQDQVVDLELAVFEADHGDTAHAVELARVAYDARPDNIFAADALGWALLRDGRPEEARQYAEQAGRLGTANGLIAYHVAELYTELGDVDRARAALEVAVGQHAMLFEHRDRLAELAVELAVDLPATWTRP